MQVSNRKAHEPISELASFTNYGKTFSGRDLIGQYVVYSYAEPIAVFDKHAKTWYATEYRFSVTTSKHQRTAHMGMAATGHDIKWTQQRLVDKGWM